jgi:hypothetical protein
MPLTTRRDFLKTTVVAGAAISVGDGMLGLPRLNAATSSATVPPAPSWTDKPMRWAQLTLVEDDPGKFDLKFWLDYFERTKSDAVCLSGGGCVAYYPTKIPFHHRSAWLGDRDVLGELITGCRKLGMVVIARTDPHATYDDVEAAHPDWIHVTADGQRRRHWASPEMWVTCGLGPYNFDFMTEVKREIMLAYKVDGISSTAGTARACATASIAGTTSVQRADAICRGRTIRRTRRGARTFSGGRTGCSRCGGSGMTPCARSTRTRA